MKLSYKLFIAAFFVTIIGSFIWSANHYHNQAIE
ncbi:lysis protein, partial [Escherichia coli]|nr:lysis protein [Escherichia coli]